VHPNSLGQWKALHRAGKLDAPVKPTVRVSYPAASATFVPVRVVPEVRSPQPLRALMRPQVEAAFVQLVLASECNRHTCRSTRKLRPLQCAGRSRSDGAQGIADRARRQDRGLRHRRHLDEAVDLTRSNHVRPVVEDRREAGGPTQSTEALKQPANPIRPTFCERTPISSGCGPNLCKINTR
jgi:hypothetical protein